MTATEIFYGTEPKNLGRLAKYSFDLEKTKSKCDKSRVFKKAHYLFSFGVRTWSECLKQAWLLEKLKLN